MSATLSRNTVDPNETVFIEGSVRGSQERNISVFLGEEKIKDVGPLNGTFRIPVDADEVDGRELRLESGESMSSFDLEVNPHIELSELEVDGSPALRTSTPVCVNLSASEEVELELYHNQELIGDQAADRRTCFNSSIKEGRNHFQLNANSSDGGTITRTLTYRADSAEMPENFNQTTPPATDDS